MWLHSALSIGSYPGLNPLMSNPRQYPDPKLLSPSPGILIKTRSPKHLMKTSILIFVAFLCSTALTVRGADTFKIDPVHSSVLFGIKHVGVTNFYAFFNDISGTMILDKDNPAKSSFELAVPVESLYSRNPKRDQHLKSPDFFNAKQF